MQTDEHTTCPMLVHGGIDDLVDFHKFILSIGWGSEITDTAFANAKGNVYTPHLARQDQIHIWNEKDGGMARMIFSCKVSELDDFMLQASQNDWRLQFHGYEIGAVGFPCFSIYRPSHNDRKQDAPK